MLYIINEASTTKITTINKIALYILIKPTKYPPNPLTRSPPLKTNLPQIAHQHDKNDRNPPMPPTPPLPQPLSAQRGQVLTPADPKQPQIITKSIKKTTKSTRSTQVGDLTQRNPIEIFEDVGS